MPTLKKWTLPKRVRNGLEREDIAPIGQFGWAIAALVLVGVMVVAATMMMVTTPGQRQYSASFPEAGNVVVGNEVRIAGVTVGKVLSVTLADDAGEVVVRFSVDSGTVLGDTSSIDVRMSTPIGGSYLAVANSGTRPLGAATIPAARVSLPYQVSEIVPKMSELANRVDTETLRRTLAQVNDAVDHVAPARSHEVLNSVEKLTDVFEQQRATVDQMVTLANDYVRALNSNRKAIAGVLDALQEFVVELYPYRNNLPGLAEAINKLFVPIGAAGRSVLTDRMVPVMTAVMKAEDTIRSQIGRIDETVAAIVSAMDRLGTVTSEGRATIDLTKMIANLSKTCIPTPTREC